MDHPLLPMPAAMGEGKEGKILVSRHWGKSSPVPPMFWAPLSYNQGPAQGSLTQAFQGMCEGHLIAWLCTALRASVSLLGLIP